MAPAAGESLVKKAAPMAKRGLQFVRAQRIRIALRRLRSKTRPRANFNRKADLPHPALRGHVTEKPGKNDNEQWDGSAASYQSNQAPCVEREPVLVRLACH